MSFSSKSPLGKRLMILREEMNYSQKEFSEFLAMPPASISAYENGRNSPTLEVLVKIAQNCNVSIDWLCGLSSQQKSRNQHGYKEHSPFPTTGGQRIKALRTRQGLTQKALAEQAGLSESAIKKYEAGERVPRPAQRKKIAASLNISEAALLDTYDEKIQQLQNALLLACRTLADYFYLPGQDDDESEKIRTTRWYEQLMEQAVSVAVCRVCGCTEENACGDGCYWVEPDLCSSCAEAGDGHNG